MEGSKEANSHRLQVGISKDLLRRSRIVAANRDACLNDVVRQALQEHVEHAERAQSAQASGTQQ